jgi:hypothetical protein
MSDSVEVLLSDTVTKLAPDCGGQVLVSGSHGGRYSGYLVARARLRAAILHDAGVGKRRAGIGSLDYLNSLGIAAATASHRSAPIGDAQETLRNGEISYVNVIARDLGCFPGLGVRECAEVMKKASLANADPPHYGEARVLLRSEIGEPKVWALDSVSLTNPKDDSAILVTGSHGALPGGRKDLALGSNALAAVFNDAGNGPGDRGRTRLPVLDSRHIAAATVGADTACIGEGLSSYNEGILTFVNDTAQSHGAFPGMTTKEFIDQFIRFRSRDQKSVS